MLAAVDSEGKRVISDSTEKLIKDILHQYRAGQGQDDVATRKASFALNRRMFEKRLEEDKKYREAFLKYKSLERDAWYLRYGDYLAISLADLRGKEKAAHKPAEEEERGDAEAYRTFISRPWSEIQRLIDANDRPQQQQGPDARCTEAQQEAKASIPLLPIPSLPLSSRLSSFFSHLLSFFLFSRNKPTVMM
ncbi:hypothetical protein V8E54_007445 [Elaphomyces granulatus]